MLLVVLIPPVSSDMHCHSLAEDINFASHYVEVINMVSETRRHKFSDEFSWTMQHYHYSSSET